MRKQIRLPHALILVGACVGLALFSQVRGAQSAADPTATHVKPHSVSDAAARRQTEPITLRKIILVGDSTVQVGSGWGSAFCANHASAFVSCLNMGRGGRSTFSYREEGSWNYALREAKVPGYAEVYVLIQFGHNDQPGKPGRSTDLENEFPRNLRQYVSDTLAAGAIPILMTPLTRRSFVDGVLDDTLAPWSEKTLAVAREMNVPVIDLHATSMKVVQEMGPVRSLYLSPQPPSEAVIAAAKRGTSIGAYRPGPAQARGHTKALTQSAPQQVTFDYTHLGQQGANLFARYVAEELVNVAPKLRDQITL